MSVILPLFTALSELFASGKSPAEIAPFFQIDVDQLTRAFNVARGNLFKGHFARALQYPDDRPDLLTHFSILASLEHHYGALMAQWQRAEETCHRLRAQKDVEVELLMKAETFSFRIEQAAARILRDLQKAEAVLKEAATSPYLSFRAEKDETLHPKPGADRHSPPQPASQVKATASASASDDIPGSAGAKQSPVETIPTSRTSLELPQSLPLVEPSPDFHSDLLRKHRERIKNTPPKERPALINQLFKQRKQRELVA